MSANREFPTRRVILATLLSAAIATPALAIPTIHTKDSDRGAGDIIQVVLPALGLGMAFAKDDTEGLKQWAYTMAGAGLTTQALKAAFNSTDWGTRPNGGSNSFPSGHTTAACAGAGFIGRRYGWQYGAPALLPAAFVGYTRVDEDLHHPRDVIAGCAVGLGFSYLFTNRQPEKFSLYPDATRDSVSLNFYMPF